MRGEVLNAAMAALRYVCLVLILALWFIITNDNIKDARRTSCSAATGLYLMQDQQHVESYESCMEFQPPAVRKR